MKLSARTALGVDISEGLINLALLKQSAKGVELVKTASGPVPDGAIEGGNIQDPAALARAIATPQRVFFIRLVRGLLDALLSGIAPAIVYLPWPFRGLA